LSDLSKIEELSKNLFYIDNFCIDIKRGIITLAEEVHTVEPKVMTVLLHLAANAGNVVEQESLFAKVWPKSVYSPGSIRRCITILRKIFQDDTKTLIATHPKRGYSLNSSIKLIANQSASVDYQHIYRAILLLLLLGAVFFYSNNSETSIPIITDSRPITSTKQLEDFAQLSPNGQYIAFVRHPINKHLEGHIWLKDLANDKEYKLSKSSVYARNINWHANSKTLLYVSVKNQGLDIVRMSINLDTMNSNESVILSKPKLNWVSSVIWGPNNTLYYIANKASKKTLFSFNLGSGEQKELLTAQDSFSPFELALSNNQKHLAIIGWHERKNSQIKLLSIPQLENSTIEVVQQWMLDTGHYDISWHPNDTSLLLNDGKHLYHLDSSGKIEKILYENFQFIRFAHFSPDGNSIAIISEKLDIDIWLSPLDKKQQDRLVYDSNSMDRNPKFSPTGERFAFITESKGYPQIYIHHLSSGNNQLVYKNTEKNLYVSPPKWNPLGNKLTFAIAGLPIIINLDNQGSEIETLNYAQGVPLQWYQNEQALLLVDHEQAVPEFIKLDLTTKQASKIVNKNGDSAYLNTNDELLLISKSSIDKFITTGTLERIHDFDGQILQAYRTSKGIYLYAKAKKQFAMWFYSFTDQSIAKISQWDSNQRIVDIDSSGDFLLTHTVEMEKDIVLLTVK